MLEAHARFRTYFEDDDMSNFIIYCTSLNVASQMPRTIFDNKVLSVTELTKYLH